MILRTILLVFSVVTNIHSLLASFEQGTICQTGKSQSPISVDLIQTKYVVYPSFVFSAGYRQPTMFEVSNHQSQTISITPMLIPAKTLEVSGGCLSGAFTFQSAHLHWPQSEHRFIRNNYVAEAHFIHKNLNTNQTAVFAYFFTLATSRSREKDGEANSWDLVLQRFTNNTYISIKDGLMSFMKGNKDLFVHYSGSLTTSPCTEGVLWVLVSSVMKLQYTSLNRLRTSIVADNYRMTQPLNGRIVQRSFRSTTWNI